MKTAIVYYSRRGNNWFDSHVAFLEKGNTELIASYIKEASDGDLFPLTMKEEYSSDYDEAVSQAKFDQDNNIERLPTSIPDLSMYDVIYLGYPIYFEDMPKVVESFLKHSGLKNKTIYPFVTHEGSGLGASISKIRAILPYCEVKDALPIPGTLAPRAHNRVVNWVYKHN